MPYNNTPFDEQLHDDLAARRTTPTANTIRIGSDTPNAVAPSVMPNAAPINAPHSFDPASLPSASLPSASVVASVVDAKAKERTPLPVIIAVAMAIGAVCVVGGSLVMRRIVPATKPSFTANTSIGSPGNEIMNPDLVTKNFSDEAPNAEQNNETPAVETDVKTDDSSNEQKPNDNNPPEVAAPATDSPSEAYTATTYQITPPGGFSLSQSGRRTIWKHENGAQILVETGKAGKGSSRSAWENLERDLKKRYGNRYKSLGIRDGEFAGQPAAIWEFELTGKDGITRRKIDIGIQNNGRGYALLGSAPKENFDAVFPQIQAAVNSFKLKETKPEAAAPEPSTTAPQNEISNAEKPPKPSVPKSSDSIKELPSIPQNDAENSPRKLPEPKPTTERGY